MKSNLYSVVKKESARDNEVIIACLLSKFFFGDKHLVVGDGGDRKETDIRAGDNSFAVEVVKGDLLGHYEGIRKKKRHDWENDVFTHNYDSSPDTVQNRFGVVIDDKLRKLNEGYYANSPNEIYLAIDSINDCLDLTDTREAVAVYAATVKKYERQFKEVLYLCPQGLCVFGGGKNKVICRWENESFSMVCEIKRLYNLKDE
jgi:hypothetical protein